jgi:hypothetical protein
MPHYLVLLRSSALAKSFALRADRWAESDGVCRFFRDDALVHQVPAAELLRVEPHDSDKAAQDALSEFRRARAGGATVNVEEAAPGKPRARERGGAAVAVPAEGISFRVEER